MIALLTKTIIFIKNVSVNEYEWNTWNLY